MKKKDLLVLGLTIALITAGCYLIPNLNYITYSSPEEGFSISYPKKWRELACDSTCVVKREIEDLPNQIPHTFEVYVVPTTPSSSATARAAEAQRVIDSNYSTPPETFGVDTNYYAESGRHGVSSFTNQNGVKIYITSYIGKYSVIDTNYYFDTPRGKTVTIHVISEVVSEKDPLGSGVAAQYPELQTALDSIQLR